MTTGFNVVTFLRVQRYAALGASVLAVAVLLAAWVGVLV